MHNSNRNFLLAILKHEYVASSGAVLELLLLLLFQCSRNILEILQLDFLAHAAITRYTYVPIYRLPFKVDILKVQKGVINLLYQINIDKN